MPHPVTVAHYRDADGVAHDVVVQRSPEGRWQVLDLVLVEELTGFDDRKAQAETLARVYASDHHIFDVDRNATRHRQAA
jgi:hypothetical protein